MGDALTVDAFIRQLQQISAEGFGGVTIVVGAYVEAGYPVLRPIWNRDDVGVDAFTTARTLVKVAIE